MLKRFYSKKSGFTLVEIIVAFAVFAIMASMICQILNLSARARMSNTAYQAELDDMEHMLTLIEKDSENFTGEKGRISLDFNDGTTVGLSYDVKSAKPDAVDEGEGLNYFLAPVDYQSNGEVTPTLSGGDAGVSNTGSQASRMDTRITGTGGIESIEILKVIKDTHVYDAGDPNAVPAGHTRYYIMCAANGGDKTTNLKDEDVPYSQYRLYFYCEPASDSDEDYKAALNAAAGAVEYTDADGNTYTKDVFKAATITKVSYLKKFSGDIGSTGITSSDIMSGVDGYNNKYTIEQTSTNVIRIGSPFEKGEAGDANRGYDGKGVRFSIGSPSYFCVEFEGDPHITVSSFGHNAQTGTLAGSKKYTACPNYADKYNSDGTPKYEVDGDPYVNIYGAFLYKRNYK